jgi:hypothetical protein
VSDTKHTGNNEPDLDDAEDDDGSTPFDNPFFLPVVLLGFAVWLGYDGWLNQTFIQEKLELGEDWKVGFNQWGAAICGVFGAWFTYRAVRERRSRG